MSANPKFEFLSCDWGTSSFRLRLISAGAVLEEYRDETGCKFIYDNNPPAQRADAFASHLTKAVSQLRPRSEEVSLVISGMASSTIGWVELPYAKLPLKLDGSNLVVQNLKWNVSQSIHRTFLVSGGASENEMMRGEETEAIGLMQFVKAAPTKLVLILPGTHSKHLTVEDRAITGIRTYMTGELYEVLSRHCVLRASVAEPNASARPAFIEGVKYVATYGLAASLFQTRTRHVLQKQSPESNAAFLSGLLIGSELSSLSGQAALPIYLGGAGAIRDLYGQAAETLNLKLAHVFSEEEAQLAVPRAHEIILKRLA